MNLETVNENWVTKQWPLDKLSQKDIKTLIEVEMFICNFSSWKFFPYMSDPLEIFLQVQRLYILWLNNIPQYVGESICIGRRLFQHKNHEGTNDKRHDPDKVKHFDAVSYFEVPEFFIDEKLQKKFHLDIEYEIMTRYCLNRDVDGFFPEDAGGNEKKRYQPNYVRKAYFKHNGNFQTEQLELI